MNRSEVLDHEAFIAFPDTFVTKVNISHGFAAFDPADEINDGICDEPGLICPGEVAGARH